MEVQEENEGVKLQVLKRQADQGRRDAETRPEDNLQMMIPTHEHMNKRTHERMNT